MLVGRNDVSQDHPELTGAGTHRKEVAGGGCARNLFLSYWGSAISHQPAPHMAYDQQQTGVAVIKNITAVLTSDTAKERILPFLPEGANYERVMAAAQYAVRKQPDLLKCTPHSIIDAVAKIQQWQLEIGTTAHLVPFKGKCEAIADYKGLAELMVRSGAVRHVEARVVYENDTFRYKLGTASEIDHTPTSEAKRGKITHAYVILYLPFNRISFEVMTVEDIENIRLNHSKQWKTGALPAWYAKKTVVRQSVKLIPKDPRYSAALIALQEAFSKDADDEGLGALEAGQLPLLPPARDEEFGDAPAAPAPAKRRGSYGAPMNVVNTYDDVNVATGNVDDIPRVNASEAVRMPAAELAKIASTPSPYDEPPPPEEHPGDDLTDEEIAEQDRQMLEREEALNRRRR